MAEAPQHPLSDPEPSPHLVEGRPWLINYIPMWAGQAVSILGSAIVQFALIWHLTEKTGSAAVLATGTIVSILPGVILGPFSGALVDRLNRKLIMVISDLLVALFTLVLVVLFALGGIEIWHIYLVLFLRSVVGTYQFPAMTASTSLMVSREHLTRLGGINQALDGIISIAAPPLSAVLLKAWPMQHILAVDLVTAAVAMTMLVLLVRVSQPKQTSETAVTARQVLADVKAGFRYAFSWRGLAYLLVGSALINILATPAFSLMPLLVANHFSKGAVELVWMESVMGLGIITGGVLLGVWGGFKRKIKTSVLGVLGMGIFITLLGLLPSGGYRTALAAIGMLGFASAFANGPLGAIMQTKVAPEMQGRISAWAGFHGTRC